MGSTTAARGDDKTASFGLTPTGTPTDPSDPATGCNATGSNAATLTLRSDKDWLTFNGTAGTGGVIAISADRKQISYRFVGCDNPALASYHVASSGVPAAGETGHVSYTMSGGKPGSTYRYGDTDQRFDVVVLASDATKPVITPHITGTEGTNGWYTGDVSVTW